MILLFLPALIVTYMKRLFAFIVSAVAVSALISLAGCKKEFESNYGDLVQGTWVVASVSPGVPQNAYIVQGDRIDIKDDMSYSLGNSHWEPFFSNKMWVLTFDPQQNATYLTLYGTNSDKQYVLLVGRISTITDSSMYIEYQDGNSYYRYSFVREGAAE